MPNAESELSESVEKIFSTLTLSQKKIMSMFTASSPTEVIINKKERQKIWDDVKSRKDISSSYKEICPALYLELEKVLVNGGNMQSGLIAECVFSQTLSNMLGLSNIHDMKNKKNTLPNKIINTIVNIKFNPRYIYWSENKNFILAQAGGFTDVDCFLIDLETGFTVRIEFKEQLAKTSECDLPKYSENGYLISSNSFIQKNPQFEEMLDYQVRHNLNFWDSAGSNINIFPIPAVLSAVSKNYSNTKIADVICTEDKLGFLTMMPADHIHKWAAIRGEIRPAGRNSSKVWTKNKLKSIISEKGGHIGDEDEIVIPLSSLTPTKERGGDLISRYKISPLFYIPQNKITIDGDEARVFFKDIKQLIPTISAHLSFKNLDNREVRSYYLKLVHDENFQ